MILISNSQRNEIVRYIDALCEAMQPSTKGSTRAYNTVRKAKILRSRLKGKQPVTVSDLHKLLISQSKSDRIVMFFNQKDSDWNDRMQSK